MKFSFYSRIWELAVIAGVLITLIMSYAFRSPAFQYLIAVWIVLFVIVYIIAKEKDAKRGDGGKIEKMEKMEEDSDEIDTN